MPNLTYIKATPNDARELSEIAFESKRNWGYPNEWMQLWKTELTLTPDYILENHVVKIFANSKLIGFFSIIEGEPTELDHLWLTPQNMRRGFGKHIFDEIRRTVSIKGKTTFRLVAEPRAKGFYDKMGGCVTSSFESKIAGRFLEVYEFFTLPDICVQNAVEADYPELFAVWENSVKATHDFLSPDDFEFFREMVRTGDVFRSVPILKSVRQNGRIIAFLGVFDENLEMLFIHDDFRGKGVGKFLIGFALNHLGVRKVEVNKDNVRAVGFYERFGFKTYKETATDGLGKPYPLLYMAI
ncbi:GNAT family N-acetyltransferase [Flavobacterium sp. MAH-1]|uniref:GNAT family N-acetyltransferase n=1 Tax=Flavobacterium agri TaxID=2743471 RepID=A0A7Y8Y186_9FLAO|nr:GNAT family N-acetyltransferase [Flavobacterium agri]NUY80557.1 GNAT family N-acetyltransferase [Flavobacterium agri]NYA70581.1 GNAT family N-acetyltransferase [Flavobacterium agri]